MAAPQEQKAIARTVAAAFGGENPRVHRYWDDNRKSSVAILTAPDTPEPGVVSVATIGLSDYAIGHNSGGTPLRVEIVGVCAAEFEAFPNIVATCAFFVINDQLSCYPGAIFRDVIGMYAPTSAMKHVVFVPPYVWEDKLKTLELSDRKVAWLLAVPISEAEYRYAVANGIPALEKLFEESQIDIFDLNRRSEVD